MSGWPATATRFPKPITRSSKGNEPAGIGAPMDKKAVRARIEEAGIIPSIRTSSAGDARFAADTTSSAGIPIVEITMTVPGALQVIAALARDLPKLVVGAGTVLDIETARACVDAGARFLTSPGLNLEIVQFAVRENVLVMPGVLTPTEVTVAWQAGADMVKVFPCGPFGGASYIRSLRAPFPHVPMVAAGGVTQQTAGDFILAGAAAVGVGNELIPRRAVQERQADWIAELARRFVSVIKEARNLS
jgi:2-dehydro-3-deoxyphosphogluconate aldolase/(4S)-4-hydroxy-2-oxoglutarate aldolase